MDHDIIRTMRIAHLSDLHIFPEGAIRPRDLLSRRLFGAANVRLFRKRAHSSSIARAAVEAVLGLDVDHTVITGDLTNLALRREFEAVADLVAPLGGWDRLTIVPGNHDYYTPGAVKERRFEERFGYTLWSGSSGDGVYPSVKEIAGVMIVAIRSAALAPPLCSFGRVGNEQARALRVALDGARASGRDTVVLMHHNLHFRGVFQESIGRLRDREHVSGILADCGATLVLHGHDHREHEMVLTGTRGGRGTLVAGCGSTSIDPVGSSRSGRFNVYSVHDGTVLVERWRYQRAEGMFVRMAD